VIYIDLHLNNQGFQGLYGLKLLFSGGLP
jgi:hypothetical protein